MEIGSDQIAITLSRSCLAGLLGSRSELEPLQRDQQRRDQTKPPNDMLRLTAPVSLKRVGREMRMLVENVDDPAAIDPSLLRILSRAHDVQTRLMRDPTLSVRDVARKENLSAAHLYTVLRLAWLAPDIVASLVNGRKPPQLTAKTLMRLTPRLPADWAEQRKLLGFR